VAVRLFLKIDDIKGESTDAKHKGEIDVESFSWGVTQAGGSAGGGGGGAGKASFPDFSFTTPQSVASPVLFLSCAQGKHLKEAVLTARTSGKAGLDFYKVSFYDLLISGIHESGSSGTAGISESVTFNFQKVKVEYSRKNAKGGLEPPVSTGWGLKANKPI